MLCGQSTFDDKEIVEMLAADGFEAGTPEFFAERRERFLPAGDMGGQPGVYIENPDWEPAEEKKAAAG